MSDNRYNLAAMRLIGYFALTMAGIATLGIGLWLWNSTIALIFLGTAITVVGLVGAINSD